MASLSNGVSDVSWGSGDERLYSVASVRRYLGRLLSYPRSVSSITDSTLNNTTGVSSILNDSSPRTLSHINLTQQAEMQTFNPMFEQDSLLRGDQLAQSFDVAQLKHQSASESRRRLTVRYSAKSFDEQKWKALVSFREQLSTITNSLPSVEPISPTGYFSDTLSLSATPKQQVAKLEYALDHNAECCFTSNSNTTLCFPQMTVSEIPEADDVKHVRGENKMSPVSVEVCLTPEDVGLELQLAPSRSAESWTRINQKINTALQERSKDERSFLENKTENMRGNVTRGLKRKTTSLPSEEEPTIAQLWAQESRNHRSFRSYKRTSFRPHRDEPEFDFEAYFNNIDIESQRRKVLKSVKEPGLLLHYLSLGLVRKPLSAKFREERLRLLTIAETPFDHANKSHRSLLKEVYHRYAGKVACKEDSQAQQWNKLGFGNQDLVLDRRNGGLLTLWFMLYLHKKDGQAAATILRESKKKGGLYSFGSMCALLTFWVIEIVKKGQLNTVLREMAIRRSERMGDQEDKLIVACKKLFTGLIYKLYWKVTQNEQAMDVRKTIKLIRKEMKKDVELLIRIADLPDILPLGEHLFRRLKPLEQLRQTLKLTFTCVKADDFESYGD